MPYLDVGICHSLDYDSVMYSDVKIRRRSVDDPKSPVIYLDTSSFISSTQCLRLSEIGEIASAIAWVAQVTADAAQRTADEDAGV